MSAQATPTAQDVRHQLTQAETRKLISGIQIPPQPEVVRALIFERGSDAPDVQRVVQLIGKDAGLAAAVLKTVNSPFYGLRQKVGTIQHAVNLLGMKNVSTLVMGLALRSKAQTQGMQRFWESISRSAQLAQVLTRHLGLEVGDAAQLYTLFHDSAMPLLLQHVPGYQETLDLIAATGWVDVTKMEDARHNTNHAVVGGMLAAGWGLPETVHQAVQWHHDATIFNDDAVPNEVRTLVALGHVAEKVEEALSKRLTDCAWEEFGATCLYHLMLKESELQDFIDLAKDQFGVPDD